MNLCNQKNFKEMLNSWNQQKVPEWLLSFEKNSPTQMESLALYHLSIIEALLEQEKDFAWKLYRQLVVRFSFSESIRGFEEEAKDILEDIVTSLNRFHLPAQMEDFSFFLSFS